MRNRIAIARALALGSVFIAGCTLGPDYARPVVATSVAWKEAAPATLEPAVPLPPAWWEIFGDAELDQIEAQVVAANHDLQRAAARVAEARALARMSEADLYPHLSATTAGTRFRTSAHRAASGPAVEARDYSSQGDLSYELDLWGRVRRSAEAARADAAASGDDFQAVRLALTAEAACNYFQLRSLDAENAVLAATLALRRDALGLQETRAQSGLINEADVSRARTEVANVEAELHALARSRARTEHALAILCGQPPAEFSVAVRATPFTLPAIPAGLPATLLQRRPDLAAAEHQLQAACARIGVAKADFFPRLSLTGSAGLASAELGSLLESGSRVWSFGPSVYVPLFDGGRNRANLAATEARYAQATAAYRAAVLNAFREVEDALADLGALAAQAGAVHRALLSARDTAALAHERYLKGLTGYLDVVDAQRVVLQAERFETQLRSQRTLSTILLAKAVGGGWSAPAHASVAGASVAAASH